VCPWRDSNPAPIDYKSRALSLYQPLWPVFECNSNVTIPYVNLLFLMPRDLIRAWNYNYTPPYASLVRRLSEYSLLCCTLMSVAPLLDTLVVFACSLVKMWSSPLRVLWDSLSQKQIAAWTGQRTLREGMLRKQKRTGFSLFTEPLSYGWAEAFYVSVESKRTEQRRCCLFTRIIYKLKLIVVPFIKRRADCQKPLLTQQDGTRNFRATYEMYNCYHHKKKHERES
jgi:hypothetical protein